MPQTEMEATVATGTQATVALVKGTPTKGSEARLDEALAEYMERSDLGETVDRGVFLEKYPDIRVELSAFFRVADQLADVQLGQLLEGRKPRSLVESLAAAAPTKVQPPPPVSPAAAAQGTAASATSESPADPKDKPKKKKKRPGGLGHYLRTSQPMVVSAVLHLVALLVLASISLSLPVFEEIVVPILVAQNDADTPEIEPLVKIDLPQAETENTEAVKSETISDSVDISSFDDAPSSLRVDLSDVGSQHTLSMETLLRTAGTGNGLGKAGMGKVKFFGQSTSGQRFVFVIDNSGSMTKGRFETALYELYMAVEQMQPQQTFYVIFFSDTAYPLFHPEPALSFVPATSANKQKLAIWLKTVEKCLRTDALEAMQKALSMRPDVIYLLGDGAFTDKTSDFMAKLPPGGPQIHVLGMEVDAKHAEAFKEIAAKFKGTYKDVGIRPEMVAVAKADTRDYNRKRGPVWGLKLPP